MNSHQRRVHRRALLRTQLTKPPDEVADQLDVEIACGGRCCRRFYLPLSPQELADPERMALVQDGARIADMVTYVGPPTETGAVGGFYTCKNLLPTGLCGIYADRPGMCRHYPYGRACRFTGCPA